MSLKSLLNTLFHPLFELLLYLINKYEETNLKALFNQSKWINCLLPYYLRYHVFKLTKYMTHRSLSLVLSRFFLLFFFLREVMVQVHNTGT